MNSRRTREGTKGPARFVLPILWSACLLLSSPGPAQAQDIEVAFGEITTLDGTGRERVEFLPGEEIQVRVSMWVLRSSGNPFVVRLRISGDGWYEVRTSDPLAGPGPRSIIYGGREPRLYTSTWAGPGKVSLVADIFSQDETVSLRGRRHAYLKILCPEAIPGEVAPRLQVGLRPFDMALTADHRFLYVTSQEDRKVTVIDVEAKTVVAEIGASDGIGFPAGVAPSPGGGEMLVADSGLQSIHVIDADNPFDLLDIIPLNANGDFGVLQPGDLASNPVRNEVYVTDSRGGARIFSLNLASRAVEQIVLFTSLSVGLTPIQIIVDPENSRFIYVLCQALNEVLKLDVSSGRLLDYVRLRNAGDPSSLWPAWSMALNTVTDEIYVLLNPNRPEPPDRTLESKIYVVPRNRLSGPGRKFGAGASLWDLTVRQDGRFVYAIDSYRGEILVIDPSRGISLERCAVPVGPGGRLLRLDPVQNRLFVGNWAPGYVDIVE